MPPGITSWAKTAVTSHSRVGAVFGQAPSKAPALPIDGPPPGLFGSGSRSCRLFLYERRMPQMPFHRSPSDEPTL